MKSATLRLFLAVLIFFPAILSGQNRFKFYSELDPSKISSGILYDIAHPLSGIEAYTGQEQARPANPGAWRQVYFELRNASFDPSALPELEELTGKTRLLNRAHIFPIAIIDLNYEKIREDALEENLITFSNERFLEVEGADPYELKNAFVAAVLSLRTHTNKIRFVLDEDFIFSNRAEEIDHFVIDFDDGAGKTTLLTGESHEVTYASDGEKTISLIAVYADGTEKNSHFTLMVKDAQMPTPDIYIDDFTASEAYLNEYAVGNMAVFFGNGNQVITDPIIVVDGFDPGDARPLEEIYELMNQFNMAENILGQGMDLIILNFYGGSDYIQRNVLLFIELVNWVNQQMTDAGTLKAANQIAVIGPSMGGLITRYGITHMESEDIPHNIRTWISFDSPHKGANIPLGLQHWVRFFADEAGSEGAIAAKAELQSPAAKQLLLYHFEKTIGTTAAPHEWKGALDGELNALGFPQIRKVSVINGSGYGNGQPFDPGEQVINYYYYVWLIATVRGHVWAVPNQVNTKIFDGRYYVLFGSDVSQNIFVDNTLPLDGAPGGQNNVFELLADIDPGYGDIIAYYNKSNFVPTISALALENTTDPNFNVHENLGSVVTPFDKIYYPAINEDHIIITEQSYGWFFHEVYNYPPAFTSTPPTETLFHDHLYSYTMTATDLNEWNTLSFEAMEKPDWLYFDGETLSGTPGFDDAGTHIVKLKVTDGLKDELQEFTIEVIPLYVFSGEGNWEEANRWNTPVLPGAESFVKIDGLASITSEVEVRNLSIGESRSLGIAPAASLTVSGELFNEAGAAGLVIASDNTGAGSLIHNTEGVLATVHRYISGGWESWDAGWLLISSPVAAQPISAFIPGNGNYDFYGWDEATGSWINYKGTYFESWNSGRNFNPGQGYLTSFEVTQTSSFSGPLNVASHHADNLTLTSGPHSGWHLLGNPFTSALTWNDGNWSLSHVNSNAKVWHEGNKSYSDINDSGIIPAAQGFMVQVIDASGGSLTIPAESRTHSSQAKHNLPANQRIRLLAIEHNNRSAQESNILVNPEATKEFHSYYDARFLPGYAPGFYTLKGQEKLSTFTIPALSDELVIPMGFEKNDAGSSFRIELDEVAEGTSLYLFDRKLNLEHPLAVESPYEFSSANGDDPLRFELRFSPAGATDISGLSEGLVHIYVWNNTLYLRFSEEAANRLLQLYDLSGRLVMSHKLDHGLSHTQQLHVDQGVYVVKISSLAGVSTKRVFVK